MYARRRRGFTLIEVLVALTITAIALMAALRATAVLRNSSNDLRARTVAQWSAENRLGEIRIAGLFPTLGVRRFDCSQGYVVLQCVEDVKATQSPFFRQVELSVLDQNGHRLTHLVGFAVRGL
ncbi:MAG: type II secretion system minor pseudopilin GspI [Burkholderiaceae bacterium]